MRLVVDMEGAQRAMTVSGDAAGFELLLAESLVRSRGKNEVVLLLSGIVPDTIEPLRLRFRALLSRAGIHVWHALAVPDLSPSARNWQLACATQIKSAAVAALRPDLLVVLAGRGDAPAAPRAVPVLSELLPSITVREKPTGPDEAEDHDAAGAVPGAQAARHITLGLRLGEPRSSNEGGRDVGAQDLAALSCLWSAAERLAGPRPDPQPPARRPKLAFVSPLPPEASGISDYSATLLPALSRYYDIDAVTPQANVSDRWVAEHCRVLSPKAFLKQYGQYERVLYHVGNSQFHDYMPELLAEAPGVVVLHDFYLGDLHNVRRSFGIEPHAWERALYAAHGYGAVLERFRRPGAQTLLSRYPTNLDIFERAQGIIVHSEYARRLAEQFYGKGLASELAVIPLVRDPQAPGARAAARKRLGVADDELLVCSVGFIGRPKLHDRILAAWKLSALAKDSRCRLVFVGGVEEEWERVLRGMIQSDPRVKITGRVGAGEYRDWLDAADIGVQLRRQSRGETSAAALDCMAHGLATIVNANGSMADLPARSVECLPDDFEDAQLAQALDTLRLDVDRRRELGERARAVIEHDHAPEACASQYAAAIERFAASSKFSLASVARRLGGLAGPHATEAELATLSDALTRSVPPAHGMLQLLIDISGFEAIEPETELLHAGQALALEFIRNPPRGFRVEPVYVDRQRDHWHLRYARAWTCEALGIPGEWAEDAVAEHRAGDVLLVPDAVSGGVRSMQRSGLLRQLRHDGVRVRRMHAGLHLKKLGRVLTRDGHGAGPTELAPEVA